MARKPTKNLNLPRGMRMRPQRSGKVYYYYDTGEKPRREIPLGPDYVEAVKRWAELEVDTDLKPGSLITFRYACEMYQQKYLVENSVKTRTEKTRQLETLYLFFDNPPAPLDDIKPMHIKQFLAWRVELTQARLRKEGLPVEGTEGRVAANRERSLISHVWNAARAEGLTDKANPCSGIKAFEEEGRDTYVYDEIFSAVQNAGDIPLQEAMSLSYLSSARPADLLKIDEMHLRTGFIEVKQNKTKERIRIAIQGELATLIDRIIERKRGIEGKVVSTRLLVNEDGQPLTYYALRHRFDKARSAAGIEFDDFQFRDLRAKAATDKTDAVDIRAAQQQLGHASVTMTEHYVRKRRGTKVTPTK